VRLIAKTRYGAGIRQARSGLRRRDTPLIRADSFGVNPVSNFSAIRPACDTNRTTIDG
jgi:hypothetical protein